MTFGERCALIRKRKKISQAEMGKSLNIDGDAYGRYERSGVKPSIEMARKISDALDVSLDYLVGKTDMELDNEMLKRVQLVSKLPKQEKEHVFIFLDSFIDRMKLKGIL
ncbi:MAG: helix-turn-helix transcriptional regulator [bacterium]|nr:helix-turn-helix transcriptional regulator [bacterium]